MKPVAARLAALLSFAVIFTPLQLRAAPPPGWPPTLTIGTASPGGGYIIYGQALANILTATLGLPVSAQSTQGADQNIVLLEAGQVQLGLVTMGPALQGWNGTAEWAHGKKYRALRAILPMYDGPLQMVALKDSGIRSVADMAGKRVGVGPRGGTTHSYFTAAFKALNIPVAIRNGAYSELTSQFEQHQIDVLASVIGSPVPFLVALDKRVQLDHIAFTPEEMATLRQAMPELSPSTVPAGTYVSMTSDYHSVGLYNFTVAHKDLPDDLVYAIVKAVFENRERLIAAYPSAKETLAANISRNSFLPFHPGAMRYYREIGVAIPDNLARTE